MTLLLKSTCSGLAANKKAYTCRDAPMETSCTYTSTIISRMLDALSFISFVLLCTA